MCRVVDLSRILTSPDSCCNNRTQGLDCMKMGGRCRKHLVQKMKNTIIVWGKTKNDAVVAVTRHCSFTFKTSLLVRDEKIYSSQLAETIHHEEHLFRPRPSTFLLRSDAARKICTPKYVQKRIKNYQHHASNSQVVTQAIHQCDRFRHERPSPTNSALHQCDRFRHERPSPTNSALQRNVNRAARRPLHRPSHQARLRVLGR